MTVMPSSATFTVGTSGNWEIPKTVTVTSVADDDEFDDLGRNRAHDHPGWKNPPLAERLSKRHGRQPRPLLRGGAGYHSRRSPRTLVQGTNGGDPVVATDLNSDTLTYTLDDPSGKFNVNGSTGQLTVAADGSLNYETKSDYEVKVTGHRPGRPVRFHRGQR